jgi:hypothetical protein
VLRYIRKKQDYFADKLRKKERGDLGESSEDMQVYTEYRKKMSEIGGWILRILRKHSA